jgi:hypothetical protein
MYNVGVQGDPFCVLRAQCGARANGVKCAYHGLALVRHGDDDDVHACRSHGLSRVFRAELAEADHLASPSLAWK